MADINPYAASEVHETSCKSKSRRYPLLRAYGTHHLASVAGLIAGGVCNWQMLEWVLPFQTSWLEAFGALLCVPITDFYLIIEPLAEETPPEYLPLTLARSLLTFGVVFVILLHVRWQNAFLTWTLAVLSFFVYFTITFYGCGGKFL